jgi:hypothetical protein
MPQRQQRQLQAYDSSDSGGGVEESKLDDNSIVIYSPEVNNGM